MTDTERPRCCNPRSSSCDSRARSSSAPSSPSRSRSSRRRRRSPMRCIPAPSASSCSTSSPAASCWVAGDDGVRHWAEPGDVIVLPYGDHHVIGGDVAGGRACRSLTLLDPLPWARPPDASATAAAARASTSCAATSHSDDPLFDPALRVFPPAFVVRLPDGAAAGWVQASIDLRAARSTRRRTLSASARRRRACPSWCSSRCCAHHLASAPAADHGWLAALHDPVLAPALALLHGAPERDAGRWPSSRPAPRCRARCSTSASARCSGARRSATSPSGACTWPRTCSPPPSIGVVRGRPPGRLRLGGGVQPRVQARATALSPEPLARRTSTITRGAMSGRFDGRAVS